MTTAIVESSSSNIPSSTMLSTNGRQFLRVKKLSPAASIPARGSPESAGFDLASAERTVIKAGCRGIVKTDLSIACPPGTYARIAPRSGLAVKKFIDTGAGVVDADYRGPVGVVLFNFGTEDFQVEIGDRVAQLILEKISMVNAVEVDSLEDTERGAGGFGSTGVATSEPKDKKARSLSPESIRDESTLNTQGSSVADTLAFEASVAELLAIVHGQEEIRLAPEVFRMKVKNLALAKDKRLVAAVAAFGVTKDATDFIETLELITGMRK